MSQLILPRRFTSQPQDAVDIDWDNPLTQGLIAGFTGTSLFDATGRNKIVLAGTGAIGATDKGLALIGNNTNATGSLAIDLSPYRGFSYSGWFECPSTYNSYDMLFEYTADLNSTTGGFCILQNSGNYELVIRTASSYGQVNSPIAFGMNYLTYKVDLDATTNTTQQILYVNGVKRVTTSISTGVHNGAFPNSLLYLMSRGNTSLLLNGRIVGFALHGRAISDSEARELADNHWQLFRAKPRVLYFDVGGGATDTPSAASSGSFSITGSAANGIEAKLSAASSSSYTLTGSNAAGLIARASAAGSSSYTITGVAASGVKQSAGDTPSAASSGSFIISGVAASGVRALKATADSSSYTLTGSNANGLVSIGADASSGSYTITGVAAEGQWIHVSDASSNAFVITGVDATGVKSGAISLTQADLDAIAAAVWADATAVAAHAKLDAIIVRLTC